ncbi:trimeric intracellular cation channel family protein [Futiania mangrovi]|uniref:Trimeric intracellular cation channel family protein n=1 Tax=Futiania mangrovi TaxID=2959716 RepID=A0A9J6PMD0_9PROT|nr:trimeric intracellular cation channel family protein [Futiania mangrovii]MCP1337831.1 trimeric intracellular cation channel family protein [Futiania mangrovii]
MFETLAAALNWFGIVVFAVTGALVASRKQMDIVGFVLLGVVTGIGGGTVRDLLLGRAPVFWIGQPEYLAVCAAVAAVVFFTAHIPESRYRLLLWFDALGLAVFAVTGAETAFLAGAGVAGAIAMGMITATFGGIIRDILGGESPVILSREIYVTAALVAACLYVALAAAGVAREVALCAGFAAGFGLRGAALTWNWTLPRYRPRPGR